MKFVMILVQVLTVLPGLIKAVQEMIPSDAGFGEQKKVTVLEALTLILGNIEPVMAQVLALIELFVKVGKDTGTLKSSRPPIDENNAMN